MLGTPLNQAKIVARERYAWPGGYALFLVTTDGGLLCSQCVRDEWRNIVQASLWKSCNGWQPAGLDHTGNSDETECCDHCGKNIE